MLLISISLACPLDPISPGFLTGSFSAWFSPPYSMPVIFMPVSQVQQEHTFNPHLWTHESLSMYSNFDGTVCFTVLMVSPPCFIGRDVLVHKTRAMTWTVTLIAVIHGFKLLAQASSGAIGMSVSRLSDKFRKSTCQGPFPEGNVGWGKERRGSLVVWLQATPPHLTSRLETNA